MPLSSLRDPVELARAQPVLDVAWIEIERRALENLDSAEGERTQLAYIVVASVHADGSDRAVIEVVLRFLEKKSQDDGLRGNA